MRIAVGGDHRGYVVKNKLIQLLEQLGHEVADVGTNDNQSVDYPDIATAVCEQLTGGAADRGILVCGTGIGMAITANKFPGVRAATCHDEFTAEMSRRHNDTNVLCLSGDLLAERTIEKLVTLWLATQFEGGRHARRLDKISNLEDRVGLPGEQ